MNSWIALLRGVNVGGANRLPMKDLRQRLVALGLLNVQTYIQSGNITFNSEDASAETLSGMIARDIESGFGFSPKVFVLGQASFQAAIDDNPFAQFADEPSTVHFFFLAQSAVDADIEMLEAVQSPSEQFSLTDHCFYLHAPDGIGRSKLASRIQRSLGVEVTARNLRSVMKIAELSG